MNRDAMINVWFLFHLLRSGAFMKNYPAQPPPHQVSLLHSLLITPSQKARSRSFRTYIQGPFCSSQVIKASSHNSNDTGADNHASFMAGAHGMKGALLTPFLRLREESQWGKLHSWYCIRSYWPEKSQYGQLGEILKWIVGADTKDKTMLQGPHLG
jgi:hypothetical protein